MSWMAVNNAPLLGGQAVVDTSGFADQFRDGQKLRQEYEARQQQKALNEIMKIGDHNGRLVAAQQHKYAGALVPELQKYDEARQKAALDNLQASADIGKTFGETGKINAEAGEIGVKTQNATLEGLVKKYDQISAGALTQNPQYFALMLGDFQNNGLINPDQKGLLIDMIMKDPQQAAAVMRGLAKGSIEGFKATAPKPEYTNLGDRVGISSYDPLSNSVTGLGDYAINQSPDNAATNATSRANNIYSNDTSAANNANSVAGQKYVSDNSYQASIYGTDSRANTADQQTAVSWFKAKTGADVAQQNANTNRIKATNPPAKTRAPRPVSATKEMSKHATNIANNGQTMRLTTSQLQKIKSGQLNLGLFANAGNSSANYLGINSLGGNPAAYAEFKSHMVKLASDALRLNSGVQTDMDYKRAMEEMKAGTYMPRNNKTAIALLEKIHADFENKTKAEYNSFRDYKREYDGVIIPEWGAGGKSKQKTATTPKQNSKGASIIGGILGGK